MKEHKPDRNDYLNLYERVTVGMSSTQARSRAWRRDRDERRAGMILEAFILMTRSSSTASTVMVLNIWYMKRKTMMFLVRATRRRTTTTLPSTRTGSPNSARPRRLSLSSAPSRAGSTRHVVPTTTTTTASPFCGHVRPCRSSRAMPLRSWI